MKDNISMQLSINEINEQQICQRCGGKTESKDRHYCDACFNLATHRMKYETNGDPFRW